MEIVKVYFETNQLCSHIATFYDERLYGVLAPLLEQTALNMEMVLTETVLPVKDLKILGTHYLDNKLIEYMK